MSNRLRLLIQPTNMQLKNTQNNFGWIAIIFHWLMAILILGLLGVGLYMKRLPVGLEKLQLYGWHKSFGILVLMLVIVRICWRSINVTPSLANLPAWEKYSARAVHYAFYFFMLAIPLSGWLMTSAAGLAPSIFGLFTLPNLVGPDDHLRHLLAQTHKYLAFALIATVCLHIAAALKHQLIDKDVILRRMLWP